MWDSIQNKKPAMEAFPYFDWSYSFDNSDAQKIKGIQFRPLFFIDKYDADKNNLSLSQSIDLCFLGTVHSDRYNLIHNIKEQVEKIGLTHYFFMYFPSPILFWYKKFRDIHFFNAKYKEFSFKQLKIEEIVERIMMSKVVLDIQHPKQTGLTMRTIEMIGAGRKLITTNTAIKKYDFYNENNILVIDRDNPKISPSFFNSPYQEISPNIRYKYSIEGWIAEIFKLSENNIPPKQKPKVSVITVVYQNNTFIRDAIDSVLSQTYPDIEYIIVDGDSKDGTIELVKSYGDRISTFISEPDEGVYYALNKGIEVATGDIIALLHSDDFYINPYVISQVVEAFEKNDCDAIYSNLYYISNNNKEKIVRNWDAGIYKSDSFKNGWMPPHPAFFVKKEVYKKFGAFNTQLKFAADYELMLRFILKHNIRVHYIPKFFIKMRVGGKSNRNLWNRIMANIEDRKAWKLNGIKPRFYTLWLKPLQKIFQYRF
jgi:GT2 family glycosyltransferase